MKCNGSRSPDLNGVALRPIKPVHCYCPAPRAQAVDLVGDFNQWHPYPMKRLTDGWWFAQVELDPGHHQYLFLVDGRPTLDAQACGVARNERNEKVSLVAVS